MSIGLVLITALLVLVTFLSVQFRRKYGYILAVAKKLPSPKNVPLFGNTLLFIGGVSELPKVVIKLTNQFKELFCIWAGPVPLFVVARPEDVQIVLNSSNTIEKDDVYKFLKTFLGNGILISPAPMWRKYRRILSPMHHPSSVDSYLPVFNDVSRKLTYQLAENGTTDPSYKIFLTTVDAAFNTVIDFHEKAEEKHKKLFHFLLQEIGRMFLNRLFKVWLHVDWIFKALYWKELDRALKGTNELKEIFARVSKEIAEERNARKRDVGEKYFSEKSLSYLWSNIPEDVTEDHTWWDEASTMMVGATDTGVSIMSFFLLSIAIYPEVQTRIRNEIHEVMGDSKIDVTTKDIDSLTYLSQAMMESMRLHGVFPLILRKATKDTKLMTGTIPAGGRIIIPLHAMGWDSEAFPEPHRFDPDRFSPENMKKRHKYSFIPFSAGPRNCIGKKYGIYLMKTVMVHILRKFEVRTHIRLEDIEYEIKVIMFSKTPLQLEFVPLQQNC